jgi:hypothetical protein
MHQSSHGNFGPRQTHPDAPGEVIAIDPSRPQAALTNARERRAGAATGPFTRRLSSRTSNGSGTRQEPSAAIWVQSDRKLHGRSQSVSPPLPPTCPTSILALALRGSDRPRAPLATQLARGAGPPAHRETSRPHGPLARLLVASRVPLGDQKRRTPRVAPRRTRYSGTSRNHPSERCLASGPPEAGPAATHLGQSQPKVPAITSP